MKNELVSIIIPVYNVEKYIDECISSVVSQTYKKTEILLIDDGSTDDSGAKCDTWAKKNKRIRVFHKENGGVSSARNLGLKEMKGEYVLFIDPDDYVEHDYVEKLVKVLDKCDMIICGYYEEYTNGKIKHQITDKNRQINIEEANDNIFTFDGYKGFLWNKSFNSKIIRDNNIVFNTEIHMCEDQLFVVNYLLHCQSIYLISDCLYSYRMRTNSIVSGNNKKKLLTIFDAYSRIKEIYKKNNIRCLDFMYMIIWDYYTHKKNIDDKYYSLLEINKFKKEVFKTKKIDIKRKIKLFIRMRLPFIYKVRDRHRNADLIKFN